MLVSYRLLKELIDFSYSPNELATKFTHLGLEVEHVEHVEKKFDKVITAKVLDVTSISGTKLFKVNLLVSENETKTVITAATNVKKEDIVPYAMVGAKISDGRVIVEKYFGDILSQGMLCSYNELGLESEFLSNQEKNGILILPEDTPLFKNFESVFPVEDFYLEFSLLPDRADAFSVLGIARWVEIILAKEEGRKANFEKLQPKVQLEENLPNTPFEVKIADTDCAKFYSGRLIKNVKIKNSSYNLRTELYKLGVHPINNIVDITNYVLKMYGQPLHAFDFDKLKGGIFVRRAKTGETIKTLDGVERVLSEKNLLIVDSAGAVALAGVMGGEYTEVTNETQNVFLESAYFVPSVIAVSSRSLGLITDASSLFEKGVDPDFTPHASNVASKMILEEAGGILFKDSVDDLRDPKKGVNLRVSKAVSLLGDEIKVEEIKKYFDIEGFDYVFDEAKNTFTVYAPTFRQDISIEEDLIEEIARIKGYNEFKETPIVSNLKSGSIEKIQEFNSFLRNFLLAYGLNEVITSTLVSSAMLSKYKLFNEEKTVKILNPLTEDMAYLRPSLLATLLEVATRNINVNIKDFGIFEIGKVFYRENGFKEKFNLSIFLIGDYILKNPYKKTLPYDFFYLKGILEDLFDELKIPMFFEKQSYPYLHPYRSAVIKVKDELIGFLGEMHPNIFDKAYYCELDIEKLLNNSSLEKKFTQFSIYPSVKRDIAILVDKDIEEIKVRDVIRSASINELKNIVLFDIYEGDPLPKDKKSLAYSLEFVSNERTLTSEEVDNYILKIEKSLIDKVNGILRRQ